MTPNIVIDALNVVCCYRGMSDDDSGDKPVPIRFDKDTQPFKIYKMGSLLNRIEKIQQSARITSRNNVLLILLENAVEDYERTGVLIRPKAQTDPGDEENTTPEDLSGAGRRTQQRSRVLKR